MRSKDISEIIGNINTRYIEEAEDYQPKEKGRIQINYTMKRLMIAAVMVICIVIGGIYIFSSSEKMIVEAYAYETNEKITEAGITMSSGTITNNGEMTGHPLMFYLSGKRIKNVRFSCKNQKIDFRDWKEKRDEYGEAKNFTVNYGENEKEYAYLTIDWMPNATIEKLTNNKNSRIATLPKELREDIIVMEISFLNGEKTVKAIKIKLQDNGTFFAKFDDYKIQKSDNFVRRTDSQTIPRKILSGKNGAITVISKKSKKRAKKVAKKYYRNTIFELVSLKIKKQSKNKIVYRVRVKKDGVLQQPDRHIRLRFVKGRWKVVGEGY